MGVGLFVTVGRVVVEGNRDNVAASGTTAIVRQAGLGMG
jgi:hypothetical protein